MHAVPDNPITVQAWGIERSFGSGERTVHVLRGLNMAAHRGELVAFYGPSGSGKTTLLNIIGALDYPNAGEVVIGERDILRLNEKARARLRRSQMGFIFQSHTLLPTYSALENVEIALRLSRLGLLERRRRARAALEAVGLSAWASHMPDELSGGQVQRVAIARALAPRPTLVLADEPTSGLDTRTARLILNLFRGIAEAQGTTFLIATHEPLLMEVVDTAYDLRDGQLLRRSQ
jgi:putative ABC transport system ATP-binding protein